MSGDERRLLDLRSVGPATVKDFELLGIETVEALAESDPEELYQRLCSLRGSRVDICCLDVFQAAVAQARDPELPAEKANWWTWSRLRKAAAKGK